MALPIIGVECWVAQDPVTTFEADGTAKTRLRLKAQDRTYDRDKKEWVDGKALWFNGTVWRKQAEHVADSIIKHDNVVVTGKLYTNEWTDKNQNKRESLELDIQSIGPSLQFRSTPHGAGNARQDSRSDARVPATTGGGGSTAHAATQDASEPDF